MLDHGAACKCSLIRVGASSRPASTAESASPGPNESAFCHWVEIMSCSFELLDPPFWWFT